MKKIFWALPLMGFAAVAQAHTGHAHLSLMDGLAQEAKDIANDPEKGQHFGGQTTVSVISMMSGAGLITQTGKIGKITEAVTEGVDNIADPKALRLLDEIKKADRVIPQEKLAKEILEEVGQDAFIEAADELTDIAVKKAKKALSWEEIKAFFKRGNDYNKKVRDLDPSKYDFHEVTIEHPTLKNADGTPKRFRLDSYNDGLEIVSRKATDFDNIQTSTFENYCRELTKKYVEGAKIVSQDQLIRGKTLKGSFKLEVPKTNELSSKLSEFKEIAKKYKVELVFEPE